MSAVINTINIKSLNPEPKPINQEVVVGKDILDLLSGSMYTEPLVIYREYIQNAADSIDLAIDSGLAFHEGPNVQIYIDHQERSIRIRDNGISLPFSDFVQRIVSIGASQKRGLNLRGFRGVGRLSGLGYCQELIFRGRAEGNAKVTEVRWSGRLLKEKYRDPNYVGTLADVIKEATTVTHLSPQGFPNRFFEVELRKVARLKNDVLLNEELVRNYLSQTVPVPFGNSIHASKLQSELEKYGVRSPINVEIMDGKGLIFHRLKDEIEYTPQSKDSIREIEFFELKGIDDEVAAFGWLAHHSYLGSLPKRLGLGGLRYRTGNIQVGDDSISSLLFPEPRFSGWAIGDIHVLSKKIVPNGRRDDFEPSAAYAHLQNEIAIKAREISNKIRAHSSQRNKLKSVNLKLNTINSWIDIDSSEDLPSQIREIIFNLAQEQLQLANKEFIKLSQSDNDQSTKRSLDMIEESIVSVLGRPSSNKSKKNLSESIKTPIYSALKTIITSAKTPKDGIKLSLEVLEAINKEN